MRPPTPRKEVCVRRWRTSLEIARARGRSRSRYRSRWPHARGDRDRVEIGAAAREMEREIAAQRTWSSEGRRVRSGQVRVRSRVRGRVRVSPGHAAEPRQRGYLPQEIPPAGGLRACYAAGAVTLAVAPGKPHHHPWGVTRRFSKRCVNPNPNPHPNRIIIHGE